MATKLRIIERAPQQPSERPPLLILLHGYGSNEHDLMSLAPMLDPRFHILAVRGIIELGFGAAWYHLYGSPGNLRPDTETRAQAIDVLRSLIKDLPSKRNTDPQRTYLLGFSQGAIMSYALALSIPQHIAGIVPLSGYLDPASAQTVAPHRLAHIDVLQQHGLSDDVIPIDWARTTKAFLETTPMRLTYREYPIGHSIHPDGMSLISTWLSERLDNPPTLKEQA